MTTYIMLHKFTDKAMTNLKEMPARIGAASQSCAAFGATVKVSYAVMGQYDAVCIWEAPDDEAIARAALTLAATGVVTCETLRAFGEDEFMKMIGSVS